MIWMILFIWYVIGLVSYIYFLSEERDVTIYDLFLSVLAGILGVITLFIFLLTAYEDTVVFKQRKSKREPTIQISDNSVGFFIKLWNKTKNLIEI